MHSSFVSIESVAKPIDFELYCSNEAREAPFDAYELFDYAPASKILGLLLVQITHFWRIPYPVCVNVHN